MKSKTLFLVRGLPGSGKSTLAGNLCGMHSTVHIEADTFFMFDSQGKPCEYKFDASKLGDAHQWCQRRTKFFLESNLNVVVSNTSTTEKEVEVYRKIAEETNSNFVSLILENRHNGVNVHGVPEEKLKQMKQRFSVKL